MIHSAGSSDRILLHLPFSLLCLGNKRNRNGCFFGLLDTSVINAVILYTNVMPAKYQERQYHKKLRMELEHQLVQPLLDRYRHDEGNIR